MTLIDNVLSLLKEQDYSFEELKAKTNASFFDLQSQIKVLLKEGKIHKHGFPTKYSLFEKKVSFRKEYLFKPLLAYREVFLICYLALFLVFIYSVFFKNPLVFPGLEERAFLVSLPFLFISILLYLPWKKLSEITPKNFVIPKETLVFLDKFKELRNNEDLKEFVKEFLEKIVYPYYPHFLIILSVTSLINISFLSLLNSFFTPIAIPLILVCIILIILKEKSFFNEKEFVKYAFLLGLLLVTLSSLNFEQITFLTKPLKTIQFQLTIFTIILGAITFYQNKQIIEEIEEEQTQEEKEEEKRALEFEEKYPFFAKFNLDYKIKINWEQKNYVQLLFRFLLVPFIWIRRQIYFILKWAYKLGWKASIPILAISIVFIIIKLLMPIIYTGIYIDEYNHILSGIEFFKSGHFAEIYSGTFYFRGSYVSVLAGVLVTFFEKTIFVAKMLPALIGIINFFLVYKIANKIYFSKKYTSLILMVYTFMPWFIFNHFYIRMYVFYEFFTLFFTFLFILFILNKKNMKKLIIISILMCLTLGIIFFFSCDSAKYLVLIYSSFYFIYIFFFESATLSTNFNYNFIFKNTLYKVLLFLFFMISIFYFLDGFSLIKDFIYGGVTHTSPANSKYLNFFFNSNSFFMLFFLLSSIHLFVKDKTYKKLIIFSVIFMIIIHFLSSLELQMVRVVIYILPLVYLLAIFYVSIFLKIYKSRKCTFLFIILICLGIYTNYSETFFESPGIFGEVNYRDYFSIANCINESNIDSNSFIIASLPHLLNFYGVENKNMFVLRDNKSANYTKSLEFLEKDILVDTLSRYPVLDDLNQIKTLADTNSPLLFVVDIKNWIRKDTLKFIYDNNNCIKSFINIDLVYLNKNHTCPFS